MVRQAAFYRFSCPYLFMVRQASAAGLSMLTHLLTGYTTHDQGTLASLTHLLTRHGHASSLVRRVPPLYMSGWSGTSQTEGAALGAKTLADRLPSLEC